MGEGQGQPATEKEPERDIDTMEGWYNYRVPKEGPKGVAGGKDLIVKMAEQKVEGDGTGNEGEHTQKTVGAEVGGEAVVAHTIIAEAAATGAEEMNEEMLAEGGLKSAEA